MRTHGKLTKWNDERGFGFIETVAGREELFAYISAFPRDGMRPRIGELVSFEPGQASDGRKIWSSCYRICRLSYPVLSTRTSTIGAK